MVCAYWGMCANKNEYGMLSKNACVDKVIFFSCDFKDWQCI